MAKPVPAAMPGEVVLYPASWLQTALGATVQRNGPSIHIGLYGVGLDLKLGESQGTLDDKPINLQRAPVARGDEVWVPMDPIFHALGWTVDCSSDGTGATFTFPDATVALERHSAEPDHVRVVFQLSGPVPVLAHGDALSMAVTLPPLSPDVLQTPDASRIPINDVLVPGVDFLTAPASPAIATLHLNYEAPLHLFTLGSPPRLVIDADKVFEQRTEHAVRAGITWDTIRRGTPDGPLIINVATIDRRNMQIELRPGTAGDSLFIRHSVSWIARQNSALLAVNGGYFSTAGPPLGLLMIDGEPVSEPLYNRTALGIFQDGSLRIGRTEMRTTFRTDGVFRQADGINVAPSAADGLFVYNRWWGQAINVAPEDVALVVAGGVVTAVQRGVSVAVPPGGFVVLARGTVAAQFQTVTPAMPASLDVQFSNGWQHLRHAIGGGPRLVDHGALHVTAVEEKFRPDITNGRAPRTAVGITRNGDLILAAVDGRQPNYSIGMTLTELAKLMLDLGASDAMNFDGGGSTTFVVDGQAVNRPSDGVERQVNNALILRMRTQG